MIPEEFVIAGTKLAGAVCSPPCRKCSGWKACGKWKGLVALNSKHYVVNVVLERE